MTLRFKGYPVITASNGQEALEIIAREHPALVITDILMPKLDGFSLVHRLRSNPKTTDIPIIFLSATYVTPEDKAFAISLGVVRFLEKPVDTEEFLLTVAEVLTQGPSSQAPGSGRSAVLPRLPRPAGEQAAPQDRADPAHRAPARDLTRRPEAGLPRLVGRSSSSKRRDQARAG